MAINYHREILSLAVSICQPAGGHSEPSRGESFLNFLALCAGLLIIILAVKNNIDTTRYPYSAPASTYNKQVQPVKKGKSNTSLKNVEREVQRVLYKVHDNIRDVNRDGEINCQDYCLIPTSLQSML